jgi:adenylate cyclase
VLYNLDAYVNAYHYQPGLANQFNTDLRLLQRQLKEHKDEPVKIIASHRFNEAEFYQILAAQNQNIIVANEYDSQSSDQQIATRLARDPLNDYDINHIITSHFTQNADRFYVYKKPQK